MRALPVAISGLVTLIVAELLKILAPALATWLFAAILFGIKMAVIAGVVAALIFFVVVVRQRRRNPG